MPPSWILVSQIGQLSVALNLKPPIDAALLCWGQMGMLEEDERGSWVWQVVVGPENLRLRTLQHTTQLQIWACDVGTYTFSCTGQAR